MAPYQCSHHLLFRLSDLLGRNLYWAVSNRIRISPRARLGGKEWTNMALHPSGYHRDYHMGIMACCSGHGYSLFHLLSLGDQRAMQCNGVMLFYTQLCHHKAKVFLLFLICFFWVGVSKFHVYRLNQTNFRHLFFGGIISSAYRT